MLHTFGFVHHELLERQPDYGLDTGFLLFFGLRHLISFLVFSSY